MAEKEFVDLTLDQQFEYAGEQLLYWTKVRRLLEQQRSANTNEEKVIIKEQIGTRVSIKPTVATFLADREAKIIIPEVIVKEVELPGGDNV